MSGKIRQQQTGKVLYALRRYVSFFLLMAFVVTCCMLLFLSQMTAAMGLTLDEAGIGLAAKATFFNVVLLSLACTVIDGVRRKFMVDRPVRQITGAAEKIMKGDFSVRVPLPRGVGEEDGLYRITACFNKMAEELAGTETLRTDFIANVSHELKTPLSVMRSYALLLQQPGLSEGRRQEYAGAIANDSRKLADLVTNILRLNKLENQQIFPQKQTCLLGEQLCACLLSFESAWEEKGLSIETEIEQDVLVETDGELLSLVWNNLFSNAVKFTEPGGKIFLELKTDGDFALVRVSDTGCGISREVGRRLFEKFYQGDPAHAGQGNGLGLALVKRVVEITGGEISVESEVGKGSTFTVKLRRKSDEATQTGAE